MWCRVIQIPVMLRVTGLCFVACFVAGFWREVHNMSVQTQTASFTRADLADALGLTGVEHLSWAMILAIHGSRSIEEAVYCRMINALWPHADGIPAAEASLTIDDLVVLYREHFACRPDHWSGFTAMFPLATWMSEFRGIAPYVMRLQRWTDGPADVIQQMFFTWALDKATRFDEVWMCYQYACTTEQQERAVVKMGSINECTLEERIVYLRVAHDKRAVLESVLSRLGERGRQITYLQRIYQFACAFPHIECRVRTRILAWVRSSRNTTNRARKLQELLGIDSIPNSPLFFGVIRMIKRILENRRSDVSFADINLLVSGLGRWLDEDRRRQCSYLPITAIQTVFMVGLEAVELRVTDLASALAYLERCGRAEYHPAFYERALVLVRRYASAS